MSEKSPLDLARERMAAMREAGEVPERLNPREKALANPTSRSLAVAAKCYDCVGGECADGGYRKAIRECPSQTCALKGFRPYQ